MKQQLSEAQEQVYGFMVGYFEQNDQLPSLEAMCEKFGWSSVNAAADHQKVLERKGWIERNACGKFRFAREEQRA